MPDPVKLPSEPVLDGVADDDKGTVRDAVYVLYTLKLCSSWSVLAHPRMYELSGFLDLKKDSDFDLSDLQVIAQVDPLRIRHMGVRVIGASGTVSIWVHIQRKSEPVVLEEQEIVRIRKRRSWWSSS